MPKATRECRNTRTKGNILHFRLVFCASRECPRSKNFRGSREYLVHGLEAPPTWLAVLESTRSGEGWCACTACGRRTCGVAVLLSTACSRLSVVWRYYRPPHAAPQNMKHNQTQTQTQHNTTQYDTTKLNPTKPNQPTPSHPPLSHPTPLHATPSHPTPPHPFGAQQAAIRTLAAKGHAPETRLAKRKHATVDRDHL